MKTRLKSYKLKDYDFFLVILVSALSTIGVFAVGSARPSLMKAQLYGMIGGLVLMLVISLFDYNWILKFYWAYYIGTIILLVLVAYSPWKDDAGGAVRWLEIPGFIRFQPSEMAKILLILFFAKFIMKYKDKLNKLKYFLLILALYALPLYLIYDQPDLSTTIILFVVLASLLFFGGLSWKILVPILAIAIPVGILLFVLILQPDQKILKYDYQQNRILAWLYPDEYTDSGAYQQQNSITAIGSGQLMGKGYNNSEITSLKNGDFIDEPHTDFIFTVIGEELGFIGAAGVAILIALIVIDCFRIALRAQDYAGAIIAGGMAVLIGSQAFVNMAVTTGLFPNTGMTLPFVSYGRTSLVSMFAGMGFVLNVSLQPVRKFNN